MFWAVILDARYRAEEKRQQAEMRRHMRVHCAERIVQQHHVRHGNMLSGIQIAATLPFCGRRDVFRQPGLSHFCTSKGSSFST